MKTILLIFTLTVALVAQQNGTPVAIVQYPQDQPSILIDYDSSGNAIYVGYAVAKQPSFSWTRAASTLTNIVVSSNVGTVTTSTAHGLAIGNPVTVAGATVDTDLNGSYRVATVPSTTTFTIVTVAVANATYTDATMTLSTTAPRSTAAIWSIQCANFSAAGNMTASQWVNGLPKSMTQIWDNRATLKCQ